MASVAQAIASIEETRSSLADARVGLRTAERYLYGRNGAEDTDEDFDLLGFTAPQLTVYGMKAVAFAVRKYAQSVVTTLETKIEMRSAIEYWADALDDALDSSRSGARIAKIAELLPGLGTTFKRANIDTLMKQAADISAEMRGELTKIDSVYAESLVFWKNIYGVADKANTALTVLSAGVTVLKAQTADATEAGVSPGLYAASVGATNVAADDARLEAAITALAERFADTVDPVTTAQQQLQALFDSVAAATETAAGELADLDALIGEITDLMARLNALPGTVAPFTAVVSAMVAPFDVIFDFLENPPSIFGVKLFPPISRSDIDAILDFLSGVSDTILGLLDPILSPILGPVEDAVNKILDRLNPLKEFSTPVDDLLAKITELFEVVEGLDDMLGSIADLAVDFADLPTTIEALDSPGRGETRVSFFGGDDDDVVQGRVATAEEARGLDGAVLSGGGGNDTLKGTELDDMIAGGADDDRLFGFGGDDVIFGHSGDDTVYGGDGDDIITGNGGADALAGGDGDDDIAGNGEDDTITAGEGDDRVAGGTGADRILGGAGQDTLLGQAGDDEIFGGTGDDTLRGGAGNDLLVGQAGDDFIFGAAGRDILRGGSGDDVLVGGAGADTYQFARVGNGFDIIRGFEQGSDLIEIDGRSFEELEIRQTKAATFIEFGKSNVIKLAGFDGELTADDFLF
ncbi:calcium-binding protein [Pseudodonghicola flavimaris]|uniref:Calcium-binding protein n=1 Tax=Pseudodonghicola flavimaris TaxID=3050036 RepID=A0ABT7EYK9_9RHOB|nr:calcium-binding protein [Pseudodonghicola flavimaris]MDK3017425.1 calcium-binding protein [Pseudodonghicola flavimaris]